MSTSTFPTEAELRRRAARRALIRRSVAVIVIALVVFAVVHTMQKNKNQGSAQVATQLVTVVKSHSESDGEHVTARLDAPSPGGTSYQLDGVISASAWKLSHTVWACYPPDAPNQGVLRSPFDPACADLVAHN